MQNTKKLFTIVLVLPLLFWMLAKPVALHARYVEKEYKSATKKGKESAPQQVLSEQSTFHSVPTPSFDFPPSFDFKSVCTFERPDLHQPVKSHFSFARNKIFTILFTQYISTLAP